MLEVEGQAMLPSDAHVIASCPTELALEPSRTPVSGLAAHD
jgi:hypothetical protein